MSTSKRRSRPVHHWTTSSGSDSEDPAWDAFVERTLGGHYAQSTPWAAIKAPSGWRPIRIQVRDDERIVAGAQVLIRSWRGVGGIGYVQKGPLLAGPDVGAEAVVDALRRVASEHRLRYLAVQPPINQHCIEPALRRAGYRPNPDIGRYHATVRLDLTRPTSELLSRMRKSTRANVRRAQKRGIVVREGERRDLDTLYDLLSTASGRKGFPIPPRDHFELMWSAFASSGHMKVFVAEYEGEAISAQLAIPFGDTLFTHVTAWNGERAAAMPNEALEWFVITWAKEHGFHNYDFEGIDASIAARFERPLCDEDRPAIAADRMVTEYKLGYDREYTRVPTAYEYVPNRALRWAYFVVYPKFAELPPLKQLRKRVLPSSD
jgi:lipid II:glycine glycyltransferase (peptidoglycan interpeptide bridge formation enzyme)